MSIERELLKRFMTELKTDVVSLFNDIKECLAQPEKKQEPTTRHALDSYWNQEAYQRGYAEAELKLKREQEPVTDTPTETAEAIMPNGVCVSNVYDAYEEGRKSVMGEQEPIGYLYKQKDCYGEWATIFKVDKPYITWHDIKDIIPVYTAPPKREPLSDEQYMKFFTDTYDSVNPITDFVRAIEKAHGIGGGNE